MYPSWYIWYPVLTLAEILAEKSDIFFWKELDPEEEKDSYFSHGFSIYHSEERREKTPESSNESGMYFLAGEKHKRETGFIIWSYPLQHVDFRCQFHRYVWGNKKYHGPSFLQMSPEITLSMDPEVSYRNEHRWCQIYNDLKFPFPLHIGKCI